MLRLKFRFSFNLLLRNGSGLGARFGLGFSSILFGDSGKVILLGLRVELGFMIFMIWDSAFCLFGIKVFYLDL